MHLIFTVKHSSRGTKMGGTTGTICGVWHSGRDIYEIFNFVFYSLRMTKQMENESVVYV